MQKTSQPFTRREFVGLLGGAALSVPRLWAARKIPSPGLQLFMVSDAMLQSPAETLKSLAEMGYREVEFATLKGISAAELAKMIRDAGLRCPSGHLPVNADLGPAMATAHELGIQYVVSAMLPPKSLDGMPRQAMMQRMNQLNEEDFKGIADRANHIGEQVRAEGFTFAYHNQNFEFRDLGTGLSGFDVLLRETDPKLVKFEADCGDMVIGGADPIKLLRSHTGRFPLIHLKDFDPGVKSTTTLSHGPEMQNADLGKGQIDYVPILEAASKSGVEHFFIDQDPPFLKSSSMEAAKADAEFLRNALAAARR